MEPRYLNLAEIYNNVETIRGNRMRNRLAEMEYLDAERKMARKGQRRGILAGNVIPEKPGEIREYADFPVNNFLASQISGNPPTGPANAMLYPGNAPTYRGPSTPASMNWEGARNAMMQEGDIEGALAAGKQMEDDEDREFNRIKDVLAINPAKGVEMWNTGPFGKKYGTTTYKGKKENVHYFQDDATGKVYRIDDDMDKMSEVGSITPKKKAPEKRTVNRGGMEMTEELDPITGEWKEIGRGPRWASGKKDGGFGDAKDEMDMRKKISDLAFQEISSELGAKGPRWDSLTQAWVTPPGANQQEINRRYEQKVKAYSDKFGLQKVTSPARSGGDDYIQSLFEKGGR